MKTFSTLLAFAILFFNFNLQAQISKEKANGLPDAKTDFIQQQAYLSKNTLKDYNSFYADSLKGFDEASIKSELLTKGLSTTEYLGHLKDLKRRYIKSKYGLNKPASLITTPSNTKLFGGSAVINSTPCVNDGFESSTVGAYTTSNAVSGWTVTSRTADSQCNAQSGWVAGSNEFQVVSTPILTYSSSIGIIPQSPLGGNIVVKLNDEVPSTGTTKIAQTFPVTTANSLFQFAYAGYWQDGGTSHQCCDAPMFNVYVKDCNGNSLSCLTVSLNPYTTGCTTGLNIYSTNGSASYSNWLVRSIDLTPFIGSCITIEAVNYDCAFGGHFGTTYFDAVCGSQFAPTLSMLGSSLGGAVNMCPGSSYATLQAPVGYAAYAWYGPNGILPAAQGSLSVLSLTNAIANTVYSVYLTSPSGCIFQATYTLTPSTVGIAGVGALPTCTNGTSGSAMVVGSGSGLGYIYSWTNSTNSVVSTFSVANNLPSGNYTVSISAIGSPSCGNTSTVVSVNVAPPGTISVAKPYCGVEAILAASTGTNYQWYNNTTAITSSLGGNAASYTVSPITTNTLYWLSYISSQGCRDSIQYILNHIPEGIVSITNPSLACNYYQNGGVASISLTPALNAPPNQYSFLIFSTGSTPAYSTSISSTSLSAITFTNLAGGTYSAVTTDGLCKYANTFTVGSYPSINFTISPGPSSTLCSGSSIQVAAVLSNTVPPSQYTYFWLPTTFLAPNLFPQTFITPTVAPGTSSTLVYTVIVTPTNVSCPEAKTFSLTVINLLPPLINPIPPLCNYSSTYAVTGTPSGGIFSNNPVINSNGIITPSVLSAGAHTFTYAVSAGPCIAKSAGSFTVNLPPPISISGNTSICQGQSTSLLANGADTYTWNSSLASPIYTANPMVTTIYTVSGTSAVTTCSNITLVTVNVMPLPQINISGDSIICVGETTTLNASGGNSYIWNTGGNGPMLVVSPTVTSIFSVQGANASSSCFGTQAITVSVTTCADTSITGIQKWNRETGLNIYPNPSNGKFNLETDKKIKISIKDGLGKLILENVSVSENYTIDLSNFSNGIYFLNVVSGDETQIIKLIKTD